MSFREADAFVQLLLRREATSLAALAPISPQRSSLGQHSSSAGHVSSCSLETAECDLSVAGRNGSRSWAAVAESWHRRRRSVAGRSIGAGTDHHGP